MKIVLQRVTRARVLVDGETIGEIERGSVLLVGLETGDHHELALRAASKIAGLRYFSDDNGHMNLDIDTAGGSLLVISQFTLAASTAKGRRPSFDSAMKPSDAEPLFGAFVAALQERGIEVATGRFGADMQVDLVNDGPVTFVLDFN